MLLVALAAEVRDQLVRWRSERPPMVLLGEIRHCVRMRLTFTRPYFGTARSRSEDPSQFADIPADPGAIRGSACGPP